MLPIVHHPAYAPPIPSDHRFPMDKFRRVMQHLLDDGNQLFFDGAGQIVIVYTAI